MTYGDFIRQLNSGTITKIGFYVKDYNHYRNCYIRQFYYEITETRKFEVRLTGDSESYTFYGKFDENAKIFKIGGKKLSLQAVWDRIAIASIE